MNEIIYYLSPILALTIFATIAVFIKVRKGNVKIMGYDHLRFNNLLNKTRAKFRKLNLESKARTFNKLLYNLCEKFIRKVKIEALKTQVWADKTLEKVKDKKNNS